MLITLLCLMIVVGPVTWLGFGMIGGVEFVVADDHAGLRAVRANVEIRGRYIRSWLRVRR